MADDLDAILDEALDDFEEDVVSGVAPGAGSGAGVGAGGGPDIDVAAAAVAAAAAATAPPTEGSTDDEMRKAMAKMMEDMQNPDFQNILEQSLREVGGASGGGAAGADPTAGAAPPLGLDAESDQTISSTLQMLAKLSVEQGVDPASTEAMGEDVMKQMMDEFSKMGHKDDFQGVVDNMMRQLLAKDVMYVPMKQICEKYPEWLAENESKLSSTEYENYGKQYQHFQRLVAVYETEPENFPRLMELMQDMQETGQPPAEIIKELAPGLEFGPDGMPMLPNMGPGVPGMPALPSGCSVM